MDKTLINEVILTEREEEKMDRELDRLMVKHVFKVPMAQTSESFIDGWLDNQNFYSTRIEDAWKVVEKMKDHGDFSLIKDCDSNYWIAELAHSNYRLHSVSDDSVTKAICRLALKVFKNC